MPISKGAENPISFRPKRDTMDKVRKIAKVNGLSIADVMNLGLAAGVGIVEMKLAEMRDSPEAAAGVAEKGANR